MSNVRFYQRSCAGERHYLSVEYSPSRFNGEVSAVIAMIDRYIGCANGFNGYVVSASVPASALVSYDALTEWYEDECDEKGFGVMGCSSPSDLVKEMDDENIKRLADHFFSPSAYSASEMRYWDMDNGKEMSVADFAEAYAVNIGIDREADPSANYSLADYIKSVVEDGTCICVMNPFYQVSTWDGKTFDAFNDPNEKHIFCSYDKGAAERFAEDTKRRNPSDKVYLSEYCLPECYCNSEEKMLEMLNAESGFIHDENVDDDIFFEPENVEEVLAECNETISCVVWVTADGKPHSKVFSDNNEMFCLLNSLDAYVEDGSVRSYVVNDWKLSDF